MSTNPPSLCRKICSNVAGIFFKKAVNVGFTKPALNYKEQVDLLLARGLIAEPEDLLQTLTQVNYYRLSGYLYPFKQIGQENFVPDITLYSIRDRYNLDKKLRLLLLDAVEVIEISILRSRLVEHFACKYGAFGYLDSSNFKDKQHSPASFHLDLVKNTETLLKSNVDYIERFREHYPDAKHLPLWMLVEKLTFGDISRILGNMHMVDRAELAKQFDLPHGLFISWIHAIAYVRNLCAHHERLWNRTLSITPKFPDFKHLKEFHTPVKVATYRSRVFPIIVTIQFLLNKN